MSKRYGVTLPLRQARDMDKQGAVLDALLGRAGRILDGLRLVLDRAPQALPPPMGAEVISTLGRGPAQTRVAGPRYRTG